MHQKINNNKKESLEKKYKSASTGCLNAIIGILFALFILYILATAVPGFLAYRDRGRIVRIPSIAKEIQTALKTYAEKHPARLYPENIPNYEALRMIVSKQGGAIPEKQSEAVIGNIQYESENGNNYILIVEGDVNSENRFFLVTPDGVTKFLRAYSKTSPDIKKITNMQIMKLLTNIDRNLINKEIDGVFDSYAPSAKLNIRHTIIRSGEKDRKICFSDLESYKNSLKETFTRSSSFSRKREDIYKTIHS